MTYEQLAVRYNLRLCPGCELGNHETGFIGISTIHWQPRRVNRWGLRRFLKLVAQSQLGFGDVPEPGRTYWLSVVADDLAAGLHVRFPRKYSELDRAYVRARLASHRPLGLDEDTRMRIYRWAREKP